MDRNLYLRGYLATCPLKSGLTSIALQVSAENNYCLKTFWKMPVSFSSPPPSVSVVPGFAFPLPGTLFRHETRNSLPHHRQLLDRFSPFQCALWTSCYVRRCPPPLSLFPDLLDLPALLYVCYWYCVTCFFPSSCYWLAVLSSRRGSPMCVLVGPHHAPTTKMALLPFWAPATWSGLCLAVHPHT